MEVRGFSSRDRGHCGAGECRHGHRAEGTECERSGGRHSRAGAEQRKHSVRLSPRETTFLSVTLVLAIVGTTALLWYQDLVPWTLKALLAGFLLALIAVWGLVLDRRAIWRRAASVASTEPGPL